MKAVKSARILLLVLTLLLGMVIPAMAAPMPAPSVIRVGYFTQPYFQDQTASGEKSGYGYELIEQLAQYAGWECEYVYASWNECLELLARGELDLMGNAMKTPQREQLFDYAALDAGVSYAALCVRRGNTQLSYEDFEAFDGMRVGVLNGSGRISQLEQYCAANDFTVKTCLYFTEEALTAALRTGEVDAVLSSSQRRNEDEWVVARFAPSAYYFITTKGNDAVMQSLNAAQLQLRLEEPRYLSDLYNRYYGVSTSDTPLFTRAENAYLQSAPPLRCLYDANWRPLSYTDENGRFAGIVADVFRAVGLYTGLQFEFIPYTGPMPLALLEAGQADLICAYEQSSDWADDGLLQLTDPYLGAPNVMVRDVRNPNGPVILPANRFSPTQFLPGISRHNTVSYADTEADCIAAVRQGSASATYINTHVANFLLQRASNGSLAITSMASNQDDLCIAVSSDCDTRLLSILDNALRFTSDAQMSRIITSNTTLSGELSLQDFLNLYPTQALSLAVGLLFAVILFLSIVLYQRGSSNRKIYDLLYMDSLTGIWNLNKFRMEGEKLLAASRPDGYVLLYADIDHFKSYNETYGYAKSDQILRTISDIVQHSLRAGEALARVNADRFVALLRVADRSQLLPRLEALNRAINTTLETEKNIGRISLITGVCFPGQAETDIAYLMDCANEARKTVKGSHRSACAVYDEAMRHSRQSQRELEACMEGALQAGEFVAFYQPKYQIETHQIVGAEALARWLHPEKGMIAPGEFIPLFERNGFVVELDFCIYEQVCKLLRRRLEAALPVVPISTNFSRVDLSQTDFCSRLKAIADRHQIPTHLLELELTESAVEHSSDQMIALSRQLKDLGFLLSMDDFGSGYSSLNLLKRLPVDTLKLDKNFLQEGLTDEKTRILIEGFVSIAHRMDMLVVCEGVERIEQAEFLSAIGCHIAQGYLYAYPMPEEAFERTLQQPSLVPTGL